MTFLKLSYAPYLLFVVFLVLLFWIYDYKKYFQWLKDCFGLKPNLRNYLGKLTFVLSVLCFCLALLDFRGHEEQVDTPLSDQKTIILIDTSSSMLVEDVQPNRFKRALTVARHFVKNAVGHQISINVFSDISKRLVPFTDDIDLLDARLAGLEDERLRGGGSNITAALAEIVESLKQETSNGNPGGNILLITDAEENTEPLNFEAPAGISIAVIGVGTVSGGKIPMRTQSGTFSGYKTHMNKEVISKLDEDYLDRLASHFKRSRKWVVLSFNLPTEEVLSFFREGATQSVGIDQNKIRPVLSQWFVSAGVAFYILSVIFTQMRSYVLVSLLFLLVLPNAEANPGNIEKPLDLESDWSPQKKQSLAFELAKEKKLEKAELLYREASQKLSPEAKANLGATLLAQGKAEGLEILHETLRENAGKNIELERTIHSNVKKYLSQNGGGGGQGDEGEEGEESKKEKSDNSGDGDEKKERSSTGEGSDQDEKNNDKNENKDQANDGEQKQQQKITNMAQREREIDKKRRMMKVPALLKQLMQDDRALQSEFIDTITQDRDNSRQKKDW
ncbi:MAG: hypothetical protein CME71_05710 [Halobacteriovorax sp.]|nr:hypothetical protein [Halobacteriovorax sp.]